MDITEKFKLIQGEIDKQINVFSAKRIRTKQKAFRLKVYSVLSASGITILLGINLQSELLLTIFKNVSLILGAVITVINAVESFYDYRSLWIQYTITLVRLYDLKREIQFYTAGEDASSLDMQEFSKYLAKLETILKDDLKSWLKIKARTVSTDTGNK